MKLRPEDKESAGCSGNGAVGGSMNKDIAAQAKYGAAAQARLPFVSIIVTAHNYERYVGECIGSIRAQSYSNFECLVVDDASTDCTFETVQRILSTWGDSRFSIASTPHNLGQMGAQVFGLSGTNSEFVVFVDADDLLHETFLERHIFAHLNCEASVAFTSSDQWTIDGKGTVLSFHHSDLLSRLYTDLGKDVTIENDGHEPMRAVLLPWQKPQLGMDDWWWATQSTMMFRRSVLDLILPEQIPESAYRICADTYFVRFAQLVGGSLILREPLGSYRRHGSNNFAGKSFIGARIQTGDMRQAPPLSDFYVLGAAAIAEKSEQFITVLGPIRHRQLKMWFQMGAIGINPLFVVDPKRVALKAGEFADSEKSTETQPSLTSRSSGAEYFASFVTLVVGISWPSAFVVLTLLAYYATPSWEVMRGHVKELVQDLETGKAEILQKPQQ